MREAAEACRRGGIRFGIYLSPWDRNHKTYGYGKAYDDYFVAQLTELLTGYGEICSVWFDGACGEGENGKKQIYDWDRYYEVIRSLQPEACIHVCGPDVRWCGNEAGDTREAEWSVVPERTRDTEKIAEASQQANDITFRERMIRAQDQDLGSRTVLENEERLIWYPAEVNTSICPGWFYHPAEDDQVRSLQELLHIYYHSVGGNATFLLNIPPMPNGLFHEKDVQRLREMGDYLRRTFAVNLAEQAKLLADTWENGYEIDGVRTDDYETCFKTADGVKEVEVRVVFPKKMSVSHVVLKENIRMSQRIEKFRILDGEGTELYVGSTVGYQKIAVFPKVQTAELVLQILESRVCPTLAFIGVYGA